MAKITNFKVFLWWWWRAWMFKMSLRYWQIAL